MPDLVAIAYDDEYQAAEVLNTLRRLEREYLIDLNDAVTVTKDAAGEVKLHQSMNLTASGAVGGGFWGLLVGALFLAPVAGAAVGAGVGALAGKLSDVGVDDQFARELGERLEPRTSALLVLVERSTPDRVLPEIKHFGGQVLQTSLAPDAEERLRAALDATSSGPSAQAS
jgi:uncharacterized membrane protein